MSNILHILRDSNAITVVENVESWKDAVRLCFKPLLDNNSISKDYIETAIKSGENSDFYYLIDDGLAMPHARPEDGVKQTGFSILIVRQGVEFGDHMFNPIYCIVGLAAVDSNSHVDTMLQITDILGDEGVITAISKLQTPSEVIEFLSK